MKNLYINQDEIKLPETWQDVMWDDFVSRCELSEELTDEEFLFKMVCIITRKDKDFWRQYQDEETYKYITDLIGSVFFSDPGKLAYSHTFTYEGKQYELPKNLRSANIGQYQDALAYAKSIIKEEGEEPTIKETNKVAEIIAKIFLQPVIDNSKYNHNSAIQIKTESFRYADVMGWSAFFLKKAENWRKSILGKWHNLNTIKTKSEQDMNELVKDLGLP